MTDPLRHPFIEKLFFRQRPGPVADPTYVEVTGARLACVRAPGRPMVLIFHSNGETADDARQGIGAAFQSLGAGVFIAEQRGVGGSTGQQTFPALLDDAEALLLATGVPPGEVVVFGRSIGSLPAIELASRHALRGLIVEGGIASLAERIMAYLSPAELGLTAGVLEQAARQQFDHEQKLARHRAPILVMASGTDEQIDRSHAERLVSWAGSEDKELVVFPRGRHATVLADNRDAYVETLRRFLARL